MVSHPNDIDPLTLALQPPPDETLEQQAERLRVEEEARRISNLIDEQIKADRAQMKKAVNAHKILLLGQAESGKSTTLKNFQMMFTPKAFAQECKRWKPLIQLNLIRSILVILDNLMVGPSLSNLDVDNYLSLDPNTPNAMHSRRFLDLEDNQHLLGAKIRTALDNDLSGNGPPYPMPQLTRQHESLKMRLSPLTRLQEYLISRLAAEFGDATSRSSAKFAMTKGDEFFVRAKGLLRRRERSNSTGTTRSGSSIDREDDNEITNVLDACRDDMIALWQDPTVKEILHRRDVHLEEGPGFFLHDIQRVASRDFVPTTEDVLRARLRTIGVQEHRFLLETGPDAGREWRIYDVGGSRNQRASWVPFFDDCHIIFLAPVSCFDQVLAEDRRVNRVEDSMILWEMINASKLLSRTEIVLFLNKCDILTAKLKAGTRFKNYVPGYEGSNTMDGVTRFLRHRFRAIQKNHSSRERIFYCHLTAVTDPNSTRKILTSIQEIMIRTQLSGASLL